MCNQKLTPKQKRFVEEYLIDFNATAAAIRAGYSECTAKQIAHNMLAMPHIQEAIAAARAEMSKRAEITQDMVLDELRKIGFADIRNFLEWGPDGVTLNPSSAIPDEAAGCIAEVSETINGVKLKMHDKLAALGRICDILGFKAVEKKSLELTGKDGTPLETRIIIGSIDDDTAGD